jgi:hypothetical protein
MNCISINTTPPTILRDLFGTGFPLARHMNAKERKDVKQTFVQQKSPFNEKQNKPTRCLINMPLLTPCKREDAAYVMKYILIPLVGYLCRERNTMGSGHMVDVSVSQPVERKQ